MNKIFIASDHAGVELKSQIIKKFPSFEWVDLGPQNKDSVDYPDYADKVCLHIESHPNQVGVLICGSGQGMAIRANKYPHIRAALCWNEEVAQLSRQHNDANILCLGARFINEELASKILHTFTQTKFDGGRHSQRVAKLSKSTNT